jgi:DNA-binding LacI/PurR family transcriptional regulator
MTFADLTLADYDEQSFIASMYESFPGEYTLTILSVEEGYLVVNMLFVWDEPDAAFSFTREVAEGSLDELQLEGYGIPRVDVMGEELPFLSPAVAQQITVATALVTVVTSYAAWMLS